MSTRPLSPHLSVYKPQITSGTSIIGRLCGIYTYIFIIISLWSLIFSIYKYTNPLIPLYIAIMVIKTSAPIVSVISYLILFTTVFCITFFTGTLIRHILWDHNLALELKTASVIGYITIASSAFLSILTVVLIALM
jgi:succinate dehydrogenase / fumarate reductase cytochrome b subunit